MANTQRIGGIEFDARDYEFSHGKLPRGRGSWAFSPFEDIDSSDKRIIWVSGLYTDARKRAAVIASAYGLDTLYVLA